MIPSRAMSSVNFNCIFGDLDSSFVRNETPNAILDRAFTISALFSVAQIIVIYRGVDPVVINQIIRRFCNSLGGLSQRTGRMPNHLRMSKNL
ncbi:hypothetical protein BDR07DRAFT_1388071 [Suillus spraguei]|nr:hypothetical protein BDR07DRAFT_1388071 [Suillus spraguei]